MLGTVEMNIFDAVNRPTLKNDIKMLEQSEIGSWLLLQTLDESVINGVEPRRAERTGFSLFKDKNIMVFYK